jgi:dCTP deaminase
VIFTDREIQIALSESQISIKPEPELDAYSSTSVDLRLADRLTVFKETLNTEGVETIIDPRKGFAAEKTIRLISDEMIIGDDGYPLNPKTLVLGWTLEEVCLPIQSRIAARVEGKSSLARLGLLVHLTAPTIHSGFDNLIRLELFNLGVVPIRLRKGMRICQLVFELTMGVPQKGFSAIQTA